MFKMKTIWVLFTIFILFESFGSAEKPTLLEYHKKLVDDVFKEYDNEVSPVVIDAGNRTFHGWNYTLQLGNLKLTGLDESNELISVVTEIYQSWNDPRLKWNHTKYDGIFLIYVRQDKVWSPPFTALSSSEVRDHRDQDFRMTTIFSKGTLETHIPTQLTTSCKLYVIDFPFDTQICEIRTGVPFFYLDLYNINIQIPSDFTDKYCSMGNSAWDVINMTSGIKIVPSGDRRFGDEKYGVIKIHLKRNSVFYIYMIILPTFIINIISSIGVFLRNTDRVDRLTIGLTHIMTMTFILGMLAEKIPKTEEVPLLGKYIIFNLCSMIVAIIVSTYFKLWCHYFTVAFTKHHIEEHLCIEKNTKNENNRGNLSIEHDVKKKKKKEGTKIEKHFRIIFVTILQFANVFSFAYMIYRYVIFELAFRNFDLNCRQMPKPSMEFDYFEN